MVSVVDPLIPPEVAVMMVEPVVVVAVTRPCVPAVLPISAIPGSDEVQVTDDVIFTLLLFE